MGIAETDSGRELHRPRSRRLVVSAMKTCWRIVYPVSPIDSKIPPDWTS